MRLRETERRKDGETERRRDGETEIWRYGDMEIWRYGDRDRERERDIYMQILLVIIVYCWNREGRQRSS